MFNFKKIKIDRRKNKKNTSSFVGIRKNSNNELEFRLPKGFINFPENDFDATKKLFFRMYRTFKKFEKDNKSLESNQRSTGKDNIERKDNSYKFTDKEDNEVVLYSKISVIENLFKAYSDLSLDVIERKIGRNEEINYSKIDKYLHKAIYMDRDVIYIDEMDLPRHLLDHKSMALIDLFCFILFELETELESESDGRVVELASYFKEKYLNHNQSLFDENTFEETITILKDTLDNIDKITAYKDEDYWRLYEAIEIFLYGELDMHQQHNEGVFWGISNFYSIWEDMCATYIFRNSDEYNVIYADTNIHINKKPVSNHLVAGHKIFKKDKFENPFFIEFRKIKRWMRPDLVYYSSNKSKIFDEIIRIDTYKKSDERLNFKVTLLKNKYRNIYKSFCSNLKKKLSGGRVFSNGNSTTFNFYLYSFFQENKLFIENKFNMHNKVLTILDWKYMACSDFYKKSEKVDRDITKQICYEFCLSESNADIKNQFVIPFFYDSKLKNNNGIGCVLEKNKIYKRINDVNIDIFKADFEKIQGFYLKNDTV